MRQHIEFRVQTPPPKTGGWYYARRKNHPEAEIGIRFYSPLLEEYIDDRYDWFGPVTEVREASHG